MDNDVFRKFMAMASHDLKNYLQIVDMNLEMIHKNAISPLAMQYSDQAIRASGRMHRILKNLLELSRIEEGMIHPKIRSIPVGEVMENAIVGLKQSANNAGVDLFMANSCTPAGNVDVDPDLIDEAITNLILNAIKFAGIKYPEKGGIVRVRCEEILGERIKISVEDNADGVSQEQIPHLFDAYWQAKISRGASVGLGLSIVKGLIEAHHGEVGVNSVLHEGSSFWIILNKHWKGDATRAA